MPDPLKIRILCSKCAQLLEGAPPCELCGSVEFEPYIPLRFVPEDIIEELRAQELEFNARGGPRRLTEEEREKLPPAAEVFVEPEEPETPATGSEIPDDLPEELKGGFS